MATFPRNSQPIVSHFRGEGWAIAPEGIQLAWRTCHLSTRSITTLRSYVNSTHAMRYNRAMNYTSHALNHEGLYPLQRKGEERGGDGRGITGIIPKDQIETAKLVQALRSLVDGDKTLPIPSFAPIAHSRKP